MNNKLIKKLSNVFTLLDYIRMIGVPLENGKRVKAIQNRNLRKLMKRAYEIPFYRERFDAAGLKPDDIQTAEDLVRFPVLTKEQLKEWVRKETESNPEKYADWISVTTSGSTGIPLKTMITPRENAKLAANWLRIGYRNGLNPFFDKTMALKDPEIIKARNGRDSIVQKFGILQRFCIPFFSDGKTVLENLNREKPDFLYIHRSKLVETLLYAEKMHIEVYKPKLLGIIGEGVDAGSAPLIDKYFSGVYFSSYGTMETGACSYTKKGTYKKHVVTQDTHIINVVDDAGKLSTRGKMLITNLFFYGFPVINYDIQDGAEVSVPEGNGVSYIMEIYGRLNDRIFFEDGLSTDWLSFYTVMEKRKDILQFRVVQKTYRDIEVQVVKNQPFVTKSDDQIEKELEAGIRNIIKRPEINYVFTWHDELKPDKNGKRRYIVSEINHKNKY